MAEHGLTRREFVQATAAGMAGIALSSPPALCATPLPSRFLGRTGVRVRIFGLGGQAALEQPDGRDRAIAIIERAVELGVNYIDTSPRYGNGASQACIGEVMTRRRKQVFLASKTHLRSRDASLRLLERSLVALRTDHLDLWQLHDIQTNDELDEVFARDGAIEALERARADGMVRFMGVTGHYDADVLARALERYQFDCALVALNPADRHPLTVVDRVLALGGVRRHSFIDRVLPVAQRRGVGVVGMKIPARGRLFRSGGITSIEESMHYVLSLPVSAMVVGCDSVAQLEENVEVAARFQPLPEAEMNRLERATVSYAAEAAWFKRGGNGWLKQDRQVAR